MEKRLQKITNIFFVEFISIIFMTPVFSQTANDYVFSQSNGTYTEITGGTVIPITTDGVINNQIIGFTFKYNGNDYTSISIAENGYIVMGATGGTSVATPIGSRNFSISPLGGNLLIKTGSELRTRTTGTAPNRVFTIQWKNFTYNSTNDNFNFQIKLYETSNVISFVYGTFAKNGTTNINVMQVGIRGASNTEYSNRTTTTNWSATTAGTATNAYCRLRNTIVPSSGLTFTFSPPLADLSLNYSVSDSEPCLSGQDLVYTLNVSNNGPHNTTGVTVSAPIHVGLNHISSLATNGTYNSGTGAWNVGNLNAGATATLTITASVKSNQGGASLVSTANITASALPDNNLSNNSSSVQVDVRNNNTPTVSAISDQNVYYNTITSPINFTIGDVETPAANLIVTAVSSDKTCVPDANITLSGTGANRTIQITPGLNQHGSTIITIEVSDGTCTASASFLLTVFQQTYTTWQSANVVVGQLNFNTVDATTTSRTIAHGSNNTAVSAKGVLAVGSQTARRVLLWNSVPSTNGVLADVVVGKNDFTSINQDRSRSLVSNVDGVAFSPDGNKLLVSDAGNNRVLIWNTVPTSNGQPADVVIGQTNFTSGSSGTAANQLDRPTELLVTPDGKLLVTDRDNHRILVFNQIPTSNGASADVVIGQTNFTNGNSGLSQSRFYLPWNCSLAPDGKLLVADDGNNRVLVFNSIPTTNGVNADLVIGQTNFTTNTAGSSISKFNSPGVTVSPTGMVAIADYGNNRVLIFNSVPTVNGASADEVLGQPAFGQGVEFNNGAGVTGSPSDKNMSQPYGINFDLNERLYVNGRNMHRVMIFGETPTDACDLSVSFASSIGAPCMGSLVSYSIIINNSGPSSATNVVVTSALPHGFTPLTMTPSSGTYNSSSGYWSIPHIANGGSATLTLTGTVNTGLGGTTIRAYASVRSYNQADPNFTNNGGFVDVSVINRTAPTISAIADMVTDFNTPTGNINFTIGGTGTLTVTAFSANSTLVPNGNIVLGGSGANRSINITPATDETGVVEITISVTDGTCTTEKTFSLTVGNIWYGYTADWHMESNWSTSVPTADLSVVVPSSPVGGNQPVINNAAICRNLVISSGASVTVNASRTLSVRGDFLNEGSSYTGNGIIAMNGTAPQQVKGYVSNLTIGNSAGTTLSGSVNINVTLNITSGNLNVGSNTLTIKRPITGTTNNLVVTPASSLNIEGTTAGIIIPANIGELSNLSLSNPNGATMSSNIEINDVLTLLNGNLDISGRTLTLKGTINSNGGRLRGNESTTLAILGSGIVGTIVFVAGGETINTLRINRPGSVTLGSNIIVSNRLNLIQGVINTNTSNLIISSTEPNAIIGHGDNSYVNGNLRRYVNATGSYDFPVGATSNYQFINVTLNSSSGISYIDGSFTAAIVGQLPDIPIGMAIVEDVLNNGFWTLTPNAVAIVDYDVTVEAKGHNNGRDNTNLHTLIKRDNAGSLWGSYGVHDNSWNSGNNNNPIKVKRANLTGFSDFAVGLASSALPVDLISFSATFKESVVELKWATASERNNDYFEIQRSVNGKTFEVIDMVKGYGNSTERRDYLFYDRSPLTGVSYYRLKQVDHDGSFKYSPLSSVNANFLIFGLTLYPNPSLNQDVKLSIVGMDPQTELLIRIVDLQGRVLLEKKTKPEDINDLRIHYYDLSKGTYLVMVEQGNKKENKKLVIK